MKKYFCISDVHSFYDEMIEALNNAGFDINNENHIVINCGDLLDRGNQAMKCIHFMNDLYDKGRAILIRGNHEDLLKTVFRNNFFESHDFHNGTADTCFQIAGIFPQYEGNIDTYRACLYSAVDAAKANEPLKKYLNSLVDYYETDTHVLTHGWVPERSDWRNGNWAEWNRARWFNGFRMWDAGYWTDDKTIVIGHWSTSWAHKTLRDDCENFSMFIDKNIVGLDGTVAYTGVVNCYVFEE